MNSYNSLGELSKALFNNRAIVITPMADSTTNAHMSIDNNQLYANYTKSARKATPAQIDAMRRYPIFMVDANVTSENTKFELYRAIYYTTDGNNYALTVAHILKLPDVEKWYSFNTAKTGYTISPEEYRWIKDSDMSTDKDRALKRALEYAQDSVNNALAVAISKAAIEIIEDNKGNIEEAKYIEASKNLNAMLPEIVEVSAAETVVPAGLPIQDKFVFILDKITETSRKMETTQSGTDEASIAEYLRDFKKELSETLKLNSTEKQEPVKKKGWFDRFFGDKPKENPMAGKTNNEIIDIFFGRAAIKCREIGQSSDILKRCNAEYEQHMIALEQVSVEASKYVNENFGNDLMKIPLAYTQLINNINSQLTSLHADIKRSRGIAEATTLASVFLGTAIPKLKASISRNANENVLLTETADLQEIIAELSQFEDSISNQTQDKSYDTVKSILQTQLNHNDHMITSTTRTAEKDAQQITEIAEKVIELQNSSTKVAETFKNAQQLTMKKNSALLTGEYSGDIEEEILQLELEKPELDTPVEEELIIELPEVEVKPL